VPEWTNGTASKAVRGLNRPSRVRITPPPRISSRTPQSARRSTRQEHLRPGASGSRDRRGARRRVERQDQRRPGLLVEVEVLDEIAQPGLILGDEWPGIGASVRRRIEPLSMQEVVLDEPQVAVRGQLLMVDVPG